MARPSSSARKIAANRANAKHSTGPTTIYGKKVVSRNALKHGIYSQGLMQYMDGRDFREDVAVYDQIVAALNASYAPRNPAEEMLIDRLASLKWRLFRICSDREEHRHRRRWQKEDPYSPLQITDYSRHFSFEEERLERSISRILRDLAFLRRWDLCKDSAQVEVSAPAPAQSAAPSNPSATADAATPQESRQTEEVYVPKAIRNPELVQIYPQIYPKQSQRILKALEWARKNARNMT